MFLTRLLALALVTIATLAHAEPYLVHKNGAVVYDQATRLVWMRCSLGQIWNGKTCEGSGGKFNFGEAQQTANGFGGYGGYNDWRVPTVRELQSLRSCPTGGMFAIADGARRPFSPAVVVQLNQPLFKAHFQKHRMIGFGHRRLMWGRKLCTALGA